MSATIIPATDQRLLWTGAVSVANDDGVVTPWRIPYGDSALFEPEGLRLHGQSPAGVRLRFATDAERIRFHTTPQQSAANLDLYIDGRLAETLDVAPGDTCLEFSGLGGTLSVAELWLHQTTPFHLVRIELPCGAAVERAPDRRPRWITYGSSISHCGAAGSPSHTWPAVVARKANLNLTSLGFGGQCHMDPMIARLMRDLPADMVSIKVGINIYGSNSLNERSFLPALIGTIDRIREGHPEIPFVVCSPIFGAFRETQENQVGMTLQKMRDIVARAVDIFRDRGDRNIFYIDGLRLFGPDLAHLLPDDLHPNAEGYVRLGENFYHEVFDLLHCAVDGTP